MKHSGPGAYIVPVPVNYNKSSKFLNFGDKNQFWYQIFPIPVQGLFSGTNLFRYRFQYHQKNEKFQVPGIPGTCTSHSVFFIFFTPLSFNDFMIKCCSLKYKCEFYFPILIYAVLSRGNFVANLHTFECEIFRPENV